MRSLLTRKFYTQALIVLVAFAPLMSLAPTKRQVKNIVRFQKNLNEEYKDENTSPLYPEDREAFDGHDFFPISDKYIVEARLHLDIHHDTVYMPTSRGEVKKFIPYALATFSLDEQQDSLYLYSSVALMDNPKYKNYLFIPFKDHTNEVNTYGGGRYLDLEKPEKNKILIDFNQSYNPYCAYSEEYNCPIVPIENTVNNQIKAGVRLVGGHFGYHKTQK